MNKSQRIILLAVLAAVVMSALYYFGYLKLPERPQTRPASKEKTADDLVNEYRSKLVNGELAAINGEVVKIENGAMTIFAVRSGETVAGLALADDTMVRLVGVRSSEAPNAALEKFVALDSVRSGDQVRVYVSPNNKVLMMDKLDLAATSTPIVAPTEAAIGSIVKIDGRTIHLAENQKPQKMVAIKIDDTTIFQKVHRPADVDTTGGEIMISFSDLRVGDNIAVTFVGDLAVTVLMTSSK